jgi:hypothetical protein
MVNGLGFATSLFFILLGSVGFYYGFNRMQKYLLIRDIPRSKINSIAMGLVELHGNVNADKCIKTPFSQKDCIYYHYEIEEFGKSGKDYAWLPRSRGEQKIPFFARDETGRVLVDPQGAEYNVKIKKIFLQRVGSFGDIRTIVNALKDWDNNKQPDLKVSTWGLTPIDIKPYLSLDSNTRIRAGTENSSREGAKVGDRKYYEYYIEPDEELFVMGTAGNNLQTNDVLIHKGVNEPTFIISDMSEKGLLGAIKKNMIGSFIFGGFIIIVGVSVLLLSLNII